MNLTKMDFHVHLLQSLYVEDLYDLAKNVYHEINWNRFGFLDRYKAFYHKELDPIHIFDQVKETGSLTALREVATYRHKESNSFQEFDLISFFTICITGYYFDKDEPEIVLSKIVNRYKASSLSYIEFRNSFGSGGQIVKDWHARFARYLKTHSDQSLTMKYIYRLGDLTECLEMIDENKDIVDTIVGIDFSGKEIAPEERVSLFEQYASAKKTTPHLPPLCMHIGEVFDDISIQSAIRRVHTAALFGVKRVAHAIALGIDPKRALEHKKEAYRTETVQERVYQIDYDITHKELLTKFGISVDVDKLQDEKGFLKSYSKDHLLNVQYDTETIKDLKKRQEFVLDQLATMNVVIELCPTSNYIIGGFPSYEYHSIHKILASNVDVVICTDDPGVFDISLEDEYERLKSHYGYTDSFLKKRVTPGTIKLLNQ